MNEINCFGMDKITCPYCGYEDPDYSDAMETLSREGDKTDWECSECGKQFTVSLAGWSLYFDSEKGTDYE